MRQVKTHIPPVLRFEGATAEIRTIVNVDGEQIEVIAPINSISQFTLNVMDLLARPLIGIAEHEMRSDAAAGYDASLQARREKGVRAGSIAPADENERRQAAEGPRPASELDCNRNPRK